MLSHGGHTHKLESYRPLWTLSSEWFHAGNKPQTLPAKGTLTLKPTRLCAEDERRCDCGALAEAQGMLPYAAENGFATILG